MKPKTHRAMIQKCLKEIEELRETYALTSIYSSLSEREGWTIAFTTFRDHYYSIKKEYEADITSSNVLSENRPSLDNKVSPASASGQGKRESARARTKALFKQHRTN